MTPLGAARLVAVRRSRRRAHMPRIKALLKTAHAATGPEAAPRRHPRTIRPRPTANRSSCVQPPTVEARSVHKASSSPLKASSGPLLMISSVSNTTTSRPLSFTGPHPHLRGHSSGCQSTTR